MVWVLEYEIDGRKGRRWFYADERENAFAVYKTCRGGFSFLDEPYIRPRHTRK